MSREFIEMFCPRCKSVIASGYDPVKVARESRRHPHTVFGRGPDGKAYIDSKRWMYFDRAGDFHFDAPKCARDLEITIEEASALFVKTVAEFWPKAKFENHYIDRPTTRTSR